MTVNHNEKTITGMNCEMPCIINYLNHCVAPDERGKWKVSIDDEATPAQKIEYRGKKV